MVQIVTIPDHGDEIVSDGSATPSFQLFLDDLEQTLNTNLLGNQVQLPSYTVSTLPVSTTAAGLIYVSDETGGAVPAFSDGVAWRRVSDRAVVS